MAIDERRLRRLDLNLLLAFAVLMRERSVSRAAEKLFIGQSGLSGALARLREHLGDPLFVRVGHRLEPTPRARAIAPTVEAVLESIQSAVLATVPFDPAACDDVFRIGMPDDVEIAFFPQIAARFHAEAPSARLVCRPAEARSGPELLDGGEIDAALSVFFEAAQRHVLEPLQEVAYACLFDPARLPLSTPVSLDDYCAHPHALVSFSGDFEAGSDRVLRSLGRERRVVVAVPRFAGLPYLLHELPVIATVPAPIGERLARSERLALSPLPFVLEPRQLGLLSRGMDASDGRQSWFRRLVASCVRGSARTGRGTGRRGAGGGSLHRCAR